MEQPETYLTRLLKDTAAAAAWPAKHFDVCSCCAAALLAGVLDSDAMAVLTSAGSCSCSSRTPELNSCPSCAQSWAPPGNNGHGMRGIDSRCSAALDPCISSSTVQLKFGWPNDARARSPSHSVLCLLPVCLPTEYDSMDNTVCKTLIAVAVRTACTARHPAYGI